MQGKRSIWGDRGARDANRDRGVSVAAHRQQELLKSLRAAKEHAQSKVTPVGAATLH